MRHPRKAALMALAFALAILAPWSLGPTGWPEPPRAQARSGGSAGGGDFSSSSRSSSSSSPSSSPSYSNSSSSSSSSFSDGTSESLPAWEDAEGFDRVLIVLGYMFSALIAVIVGGGIHMSLSEKLKAWADRRYEHGPWRCVRVDLCVEASALARELAPLRAQSEEQDWGRATDGTLAQIAPALEWLADHPEAIVSARLTGPQDANEARAARRASALTIDARVAAVDAGDELARAGFAVVSLTARWHGEGSPAATPFDAGSRTELARALRQIASFHTRPRRALDTLDVVASPRDASTALSAAAVRSAHPGLAEL